MAAIKTSLTALARGGRATADEVAAAIPPPQRRWRTRVAVPAALLLTVAAVLVYSARDVILPAMDVRVVPVIVKSGVAGGPAPIVQAPGWFEADPFMVAVSTLAGGVVREVLVLEGEPVTAGQVVARLVDDDARLQLARAEAEVAVRAAALDAAAAALAEAERNWEHPIELTRAVATAEAKVAQQEGTLTQWPAQLAAATARLAELRAEHERVQELYRMGQAGEIEAIRAEQQYEAQVAHVTVVERQQDILAAELAQLQAELAAARENLSLRIADGRALAEARANRQRAAAELDYARAQRDEAALRLERMEVRSPTDGVVQVRLAYPGAKLMLEADMPHAAHVVHLYDPRRLQVRVDVPLADAAHIGVGQAAEVVADVLPDRVFTGHVSRIVHEADLQKNTLQVKVSLDDPAPQLKPEMLARARFLATAEPGGTSAGEEPRVFVPEELLREASGGQARVWIVDQARQVAAERVVTLGTRRSGVWREVAGGLQPGDRIIAEYPRALADGQRVRIVGEVTPSERGPSGRF